MHVSVVYNGVPIGEADLGGGELVVAEFRPSDAYTVIQPIVRDASRALWNLGFFNPENISPRVPAEVLGRAARLSLELRDAEGNQLHADFVNVVERPSPGSAPVLFARFRHSHAGVTSTVRPPHGRGVSTSDPDAASR